MDYSRREFMEGMSSLGIASLAPPTSFAKPAEGAKLEAPFGPPFTDYCALVSKDISGKEHGFLAGNTLYYIGGQFSAPWRIPETETIGFTHPYFYDGRSRGHGMVTDQNGTGHDWWGWEFWRKTRGAYGTVFIDGLCFQHPSPANMFWRPDRQITRYEVGRALIEEVKFIAQNDVLVAMIRSDCPVEIEFEGSSFVDTDKPPRSPGDPEMVAYSIERTATAEFDTPNNAIHITEGGTAWVKSDQDRPAAEGRMMYDGMSVVLSASENLAPSKNICRDLDGRQVYRFRLPVDQQGIVITYAVGDDYRETLSRTKETLKNPRGSLNRKTQFLNNMLNTQIPYFRCSDPAVVQTYYYLWALYFMYFTDIGKGWETYPHTQTAVNNFRGLFPFDCFVYSHMASHVVDKWRWGIGNILGWKPIIQFKNENNRVPDNFGTTWKSPVQTSLGGVVEGAWRVYVQSGDREFLEEAYEMFRKLYWPSAKDLPIPSLDALVHMAKELGREEEAAQFAKTRDALVAGLNKMWEADAEYYFGPAQHKTLNQSEFLACEVPDEWVEQQARHWYMNPEAGFMSPIGLKIKAHDSPENGVFAAGTISAWLAIEGLFRHQADTEAILATLLHLRGMVRNFGFPVAPEAWDPQYQPWGDMYYNWDGAAVLLMLERLSGISYSVPESTFTVADHLPDIWQYVHVMVPAVVHGRTQWVEVRIERRSQPDRVEKDISVKGSPFTRLKIQPWLENRELYNATPTFRSQGPRGHAAYEFRGTSDATVRLNLGKKVRPDPMPVWVTPRQRQFMRPIDVELTSLAQGTIIRYTSNGSDPDISSHAYSQPVRLEETTTIKVRSYKDGQSSDVMTVMFDRIPWPSSEELASLRPGLHYRCYEGSYLVLPDFERLKPYVTGRTPDLNLIVAGRPQRFAILFEGFIDMPRDGVYTFWSKSDDGSRIVIDDQTVVDLNLWVVHADAVEGSGSIGLTAGKHQLRVEYFKEYGQLVLDVQFSGPGIPKQPLGANLFYSKPFEAG